MSKKATKQGRGTQARKARPGDERRHARLVATAIDLGISTPERIRAMSEQELRRSVSARRRRNDGRGEASLAVLDALGALLS